QHPAHVDSPCGSPALPESLKISYIRIWTMVRMRVYTERTPLLQRMNFPCFTACYANSGARNNIEFTR
ncbi:hypothetical protein AB3X93_16140, partial [Paraburkholderia sp. BR14262]